MDIKIIEIGKLVNEIKDEKVFILFGTNTPPELKDFSVIIDFKKNTSKRYFKEGSLLTIGKRKYTVTDVGSLANENFHKLGHVVVHLGSEEEVLPGSIHVKPEIYPDFKENDLIKLEY